MIDGKNVMVIDFETTGLDGIEKNDRILSVGVARVDLEQNKVVPVFQTPIWYHNLSEKQSESWIFEHGYMKGSDIYNSPFDEWKVARILYTLLEDQLVTSYNTEFDLDRFLYPWYDTLDGDCPYFARAPCIMKASAQVPEIPRRIHDDGSCYPSLVASFDMLLEFKPRYPPHDAMNDCLMAGMILLALKDKGLYDPMREDEY